MLKEENGLEEKKLKGLKIIPCDKCGGSGVDRIGWDEECSFCKGTGKTQADNPIYECDVCGKEFTNDDGVICQKCNTDDERYKQIEMVVKRAEKAEGKNKQLQEAYYAAKTGKLIWKSGNAHYIFTGKKMREVGLRLIISVILATLVGDVLLAVVDYLVEPYVPSIVFAVVLIVYYVGVLPGLLAWGWWLNLKIDIQTHPRWKL